jgi:hypothetical protein
MKEHGEWKYNYTTASLGTRWRRVGSFKLPVTLPLGKEPPVRIGLETGGHQIWRRRCGEEKIIFTSKGD